MAAGEDPQAAVAGSKDQSVDLMDSARPEAIQPVGICGKLRVGRIGQHGLFAGFDVRGTRR